MTLRRILTDPKTVLVAVAGGFLIGLFAKPVGAALYPVGGIYIAFLSMCLLPVLITAIVIGIAGLLRDDNTRPLFKPMAGLYVVGLVIPCAVGILTAVLLAPGLDLGPEAEEGIGALIIESPAVEKADGGILGSIIAGATAVSGGAVLIPTVAPILGAVGIPVSLALVVLATTDNIIGPVRTVLTLQANVTPTVMTARRGQAMPEETALEAGPRQSEAA
jgi:proton glutamate symport protein